MDFLRFLLHGPRCTELLTGQVTEPRPTHPGEYVQNDWRIQQYEERLKRYALRQLVPHLVDMDVARRVAAWKANRRAFVELRTKASELAALGVAPIAEPVKECHTVRRLDPARRGKVGGQRP